jgi:glucose-6-phosphate 1-dehydrogenase
MQIWKFLLLGITGDLAKKKILPALAQFAELNEEKVIVDLTGFSRSQANLEEITQILDKNSQSGKHCLRQIKLEQGNYDDPNLLSGVFHDLGSDERVVVYLAVPPSQFIKFLGNSAGYANQRLDIILEKPFGESLQDAEEILRVLQDNDLAKQVHFTDHYPFKTATQLERPDLQNLKNLQDKQIRSLQVRALEEVDLKGREGYYEKVGAAKDMLPTHFYSLVKLTFESLGQNIQDLVNLKIKNLVLGQYASYSKAPGLQNSSTETYFKIEGQFKSGKQNVDLLLESGKKLGLKLTQINLQFTDDSELIWNIDPDKTLELDSPESSIFLNLSKNRKLDHVNLFEDLITGKTDNFLQPPDVLAGWEIFNKIEDFALKKKVKLQRYKEFKWPIQILES